MAYIKKCNTGGPASKPTFGKVYVNGVDVTKNNQDAVDAIMSAFNDRKYVQDYLMSGNDVHISQNPDGSVSVSGIPLDSSLKRRKQDREKEEVAKILFGVAKNQNPKEPGKYIGRLGKDINLQFAFENKGLENEVGTLLEGDDNFAALYRLKKIKEFYDNVDNFDEIEGWDETFGNDKAQVKEYIKKTFLDQNGNIKQELINALQPGSKYKDFIKYKDIFDSINIVGKRGELTDEEKAAAKKEADLQVQREALGKFGINSDSEIEIDNETGLPVFSKDSNILKIINRLGADKNYHLNLDFVKKYKNQIGDSSLLSSITDDSENSWFYINGHVYSVKSLINKGTEVDNNDLKVFEDWIESNRLKPYLGNDGEIISYFDKPNLYVDVSDTDYLFPGMTKYYYSGDYGSKDGVKYTSAAIINPWYYNDGKFLFYGYNPNEELEYDTFGRPRFMTPILVDSKNTDWISIDQSRDQDVWNALIATESETPYNDIVYKYKTQYLQVGDKYYPVIISNDGSYYDTNLIPYSNYDTNWIRGVVDNNGVVQHDRNTLFSGELKNSPDWSKVVWQKSGGKIQKAQSGLKFGINNNNLLHKPVQGVNNTTTTKTSEKPYVDSILDIVTSNYYKPEDYNSLKIGTQGTPLSFVGEKLVESAKHHQGSTRNHPISTNNGSKVGTGREDIFKPEPLKPNWATPILRSAQLISQLAGSRAAKKSMAKAIRESYTPKEQIQYTAPRSNTAPYEQFANASRKALLDAQANTPLTSDPTKNMGYQQYWAQQRAAQIGKGSALYSDIIDKYQAKNWEIENKNRELAITTNNENNKALATMRSALHQNAAQGKLQRTGMWGQFFAGMQSEAEKARLYKEANYKSNALQKLQTWYYGQLDPILSNINKEYDDFKTKNPETTLTKEEWLSEYRTDLKNNRDNIMHNYRDQSRVISTIGYDPITGDYSMYDPSDRYYAPQTQYGYEKVHTSKKGGKLSFIERASLEDKKSSNRNELERTKAMIKSMEKGNERLFKLILKILE